MSTRQRDQIIDRRTLVPWPISPREELPPRLLGSPSTILEADLHHPADGREKLEKGDLSAWALRYSRVQWVRYDDHHKGYHRKNLSPVLPKTWAARFPYVTFMSANFLPEHSIGIDINGSETRIKAEELNSGRRQLMWERGDCWVEKPAIVNWFLATQVIKTGVAGLDPILDATLCRRFRDDPGSGTWPLVRRLASLAAQPNGLDNDYRHARSAGLLPPGSPPKVSTLLVDRIVEYGRDQHTPRTDESMEPVATMLQRELGGMTSEAALAGAA